MDIAEYVREDHAVELTGKSADTLKRWRHGRYFRHGTLGIWYFPEKRRLLAKKVGNFWFYHRKDLESWNAAINERMGVWRRASRRQGNGTQAKT